MVGHIDPTPGLVDWTYRRIDQIVSLLVELQFQSAACKSAQVWDASCPAHPGASRVQDGVTPVTVDEGCAIGRQCRPHMDQWRNEKLGMTTEGRSRVSRRSQS